MNTKSSEPSSPTPHHKKRPYRAFVKVELKFLKDGEEAQVLMQIPSSFEAADAAFCAGLGSMAFATQGNEAAMTEAKKYLASLPAVFAEMVRRQAVTPVTIVEVASEFASVRRRDAP